MFLNEMQQADLDASLNTIAKAIHTYNEALIEVGYDEETALMLTMEFQAAWTNSIFFGGKKSE